MNRYEFSGFIVAEAENEHEAVKKIIEMTDAVNKDPDGPRVYLDNDSEPYIEKTGE